MEKTNECLVCGNDYSHLIKTRIFKIDDESIGDHCYEFDKSGNFIMIPTTIDDKDIFQGRPRHAISRVYRCETHNHEFAINEMEHKGQILERVTIKMHKEC